MAQTSSGLTNTHRQTDTHTDRQTQATTIPEGQNWPWVKRRTRARLGRVAPLGRPRSVYKSTIECSFFSRNDSQMTLKVKVNDPHFQYQLRESQDANLVILAQIHYKLSCRQTKFPRIPSQNGQNDLEGQGQWPPFSISTESIPGCMFGANMVILV